MIVDSHAHIFPPMGGPAGHRSTAEHMRYCQHLIAHHHKPVIRVDDNSVYTGRNLLFDGRDYSLDGITDVDFRGGGHGKFMWTVDGVDYTKQYLPSTLTRLSAPAELMLAQMDYIGVEKAALHHGHVYGRLNRVLADAVRDYPDRFWGVAQVDEWLVDQSSQVRALDRAIDELGLHAVWYASTGLGLHKRAEKVDDPVFQPFWDHVRDLEIPVFWVVSSVYPEKEAFLAELAAFDRWLERNPDIPVLLTHGLPLAKFMEGGKVSLPAAVWKPLQAPNLTMEILLPIFQGAIWEYPYVETQPTIREYYERMGPDKLVWGSDMPNVERHCTYKQCLDYLRLDCDFIPQDDMAKICGGNVARFFGA